MSGWNRCSYVQPGKPHRLQSTQGCGGQNVTSRTNCCELFAELKCHKNASIMTWHWSTKYDVFVLDGMYDKKGYQFVLKERWYHPHLISWKRKEKDWLRKTVDVAHQMQELRKSLNKKIIGNLRSNESGQCVLDSSCGNIQQGRRRSKNENFWYFEIKWIWTAVTL